MKQISTALLSIALFIGCSSNTPKPNTDETQQTEEDQHDRINKDHNGRYSIVVDGEVKYSNLKYAVAYEYDSVEVLDAHNHKKIIHINPAGPSACDYPAIEPGYHQCTIADRGTNWEIMCHSDTDKTDRYLGSISKSKADSVYFYNHKHRAIINNSNYCFPGSRIYYRKNSKYGILGSVDWSQHNGKYSYRLKRRSPVLYDNIQQINGENECWLKVTRNGLTGYLNSKIKYKSIGKYDKTLARFILPDGRKGYVTKDGKEYYDDEI